MHRNIGILIDFLLPCICSRLQIISLRGLLAHFPHIHNENEQLSGRTLLANTSSREYSVVLSPDMSTK